jgi:PAS domain S-box-containing protein
MDVSQIHQLQVELDRLIAENHQLHQSVAALEQEKHDLKVLLDIAIDHGDRMLDNLHQEKTDLEVLLETTTEHSDTVTAELQDQAEEARRQSEEQFELLTEAAPVTILVSDIADGKILYANSAASHFLGVSMETLLNSYTTDFYYEPAQRQQLLAAFAAQGRVENYELCFKRVDGSPMWGQFSLRPFMFNRKLTLLTAASDITARKAAEADLKQTRDELQAVLNAVPGSVSWIDNTGRYLGVKQELADSFQLSPDTFVGQEIGFLGNSPQYVEFIRQFIDSPKQAASQVVELHINDARQYYLMAVQKYRQSTALVSVGIDITERRQAEEALRIAEANYRSIFENAVEGLYQTTPDGYYVRVNAAMARIHGYASPEEMIACVTQIEHQIYVDPQQREDFKHLLEEQDQVKGYEYQVYKQDRTIIWIAESSRAVRDTDGQLLYYEGTCLDVTERKREEEALKRQVELLQLEIDQTKRERQVAEITQTDFFKQIQEEVDRLQWDFESP